MVNWPLGIERTTHLNAPKAVVCLQRQALRQKMIDKNAPQNTKAVRIIYTEHKDTKLQKPTLFTHKKHKNQHHQRVRTWEDSM